MSYACPLKMSDLQARSMLFRMEKRFLADPKSKEAYQSFLKKYEDLGHMMCVGILNDSDVFHDNFFRKIDSTTTKLRTVFNGSS